jgi:hypothetical protein
MPVFAQGASLTSKESVQKQVKDAKPSLDLPHYVGDSFEAISIALRQYHFEKEVDNYVAAFIADQTISVETNAFFHSLTEDADILDAQNKIKDKLIKQLASTPIIVRLNPVPSFLKELLEDVTEKAKAAVLEKKLLPFVEKSILKRTFWLNKFANAKDNDVFKKYLDNALAPMAFQFITLSDALVPDSDSDSLPKVLYIIATEEEVRRTHATKIYDLFKRYPDKVLAIDCENLSHVENRFVVPDSVSHVHVVGDYVQTIGNEFFADCNGLISVTLDMPVLNSVGKKWMYNCGRLKEFKLTSEMVKKIGPMFLAYDKALKYVTFQFPQLEELGEKFLFNCIALKKIELDLPMLEGLEMYFLANCSALTEVAVGLANATWIGEYCFQNCSALEKIKLKVPSLTRVGHSFAIGCEQLKRIDFLGVAPGEPYRRMEAIVKNLPKLKDVINF